MTGDAVAPDDDEDDAEEDDESDCEPRLCADDKGKPRWARSESKLPEDITGVLRIGC